MKIYRWLLCALLTLCLGLSLSGCGNSKPGPAAQPHATALELAAAIIESQGTIPTLDSLSFGQDDFSAYLSHYYGLEHSLLADGAICYAGGVEASEIAVLVLEDTGDSGAAEQALLNYRDNRVDDFTGYVPAQAAMAENGVVIINGRYAALLICPEPETARTAFQACFDEGWTPPDTDAFFSPPTHDAGIDMKDTDPEPNGSATLGPDMEPEPVHTPPAAPSVPVPVPEPTPETPPAPVSDSYDASSVLDAWVSGDPRALSEKNRAVYDAAVQVIGQVITNDMTDYEKELAIHDWITAWGSYDPEASSHAPDATPNPDNDNPYGLLVHQVAICRGYSSTFQLFMDLLGIECITVPGAAGREEHEWNMVRLDGAWYCVDVTWDDPSGGSPGHRYFNVTSQFMRGTNHQWDEEGVPEATATDYCWNAG